MALVLLAATAAVGASQSENTTNTTTVDGLDHPVLEVQLDPAAIHAAVLAGDAFDLPTPGGPVEVRATERTQETISYRNGPGQELIVEPPNVWRTTTADGGLNGLILSFPHTLSAWLTDGTDSVFIEPADSMSGTNTDDHYLASGEALGSLVGQLTDGDETTEDSDGGGVGIQSHIKVYFDIYAYVDTEYRDQYGSCCWASKVEYIIGLFNDYFNDVELAYRYCGGEVDSGFNSNDIDDAWNRVVNKPYNGCDVKSHWSYKDFDGCEVGTASFPGTVMVIQHKPDACHSSERPSSDAQRAYLTAHELGKNNAAWSGDHWSETTLLLHEHRSIMDPSLWGHYHGCWSQDNLDAMASWLGTSVVESAC